MDGPRKPKQAPDGQPAPRASEDDGTAKSSVSEVQDPLIAGDSGKDKPVDAGEVSVDEAGQVRPKKHDVDLLH